MKNNPQSSEVEEIIENIVAGVAEYPHGRLALAVDLREQLRTTLTNLTQQYEARMKQMVKLLKECEPFLSNGTGVGMTTLVYISPAEQMRRAADRIEYQANLKQRVNEAITQRYLPETEKTTYKTSTNVSENLY